MFAFELEQVRQLLDTEHLMQVLVELSKTKEEEVQELQELLEQREQPKGHRFNVPFISTTPPRPGF